MSMTITTVRPGSGTPWGTADFVEVLAPGITSVSTPSHGGIHLSPERNAQVHPVWRSDNGWYEEDCEANIVLITFFGELASDLAVGKDKIHDQLHWAFTRQHAVVFPIEAMRRRDQPTFESQMAEMRAR
jgi:hypothetical protein